MFAFSEPQIEVQNSNLKFVTKRRRKNKNCLVLDGSGRPKLDLMNSVLKHIDSHDDLCSSNANVTQQLLFHSTLLSTVLTNLQNNETFYGFSQDSVGNERYFKLFLCYYDS